MNQYFNILERDDHNCAGALGVANVLNEYGKIREANEIYKVLTYNQPNSSTGLQARINQAHVAMWDKNYDLAVNLYTSAHEAQPEELEISLYLAKAYFRKEDYNHCKEILINLSVSYPNDPRIGYNLAHCLYKSAGETLK